MTLNRLALHPYLSSAGTKHLQTAPVTRGPRPHTWAEVSQLWGMKRDGPMMGGPLTCAHSVACWLTLPTPGRRLCLLWHGTQPAPLLVPSLPHYLSAPISIWPFVLGTSYFLSLHTNLSANPHQGSQGAMDQHRGCGPAPGWWPPSACTLTPTLAPWDPRQGLCGPGSHVKGPQFRTPVRCLTAFGRARSGHDRRTHTAPWLVRSQPCRPAQRRLWGQQAEWQEDGSGRPQDTSRSFGKAVSVPLGSCAP